VTQRFSKVREELERLAHAHGGELHPAAVVAAARSEESPLHNSFDWDDSEAAGKWRLHQARMLIKAVVVYDRDEESEPVRMFVSLTSDRATNGYRLLTNVLSDVEQRACLLDDAREAMKSFKAKYRRLEELAAVFAAMDSVEAETIPR